MTSKNIQDRKLKKLNFQINVSLGLSLETGQKYVWSQSRKNILILVSSMRLKEKSLILNSEKEAGEKLIQKSSAWSQDSKPSLIDTKVTGRGTLPLYIISASKSVSFVFKKDII